MEEKIIENIIPKLIFIVPYRNREKEKTHFSIYMKYIMEDYLLDDYEIYYSHQIDNRPFNRGATKNIGFLAMKEKYPNDYKNITFVFNDIDTLPTQKNTFDYITLKGIIKHFYGFTFTLGGIFSIIGSDFEQCNGFPNNWGWGLEDNAMQERVLLNKFIIDRQHFYPINSKEVIHLYDSPNRLISNREPDNYLKKNMIDNLSNITELTYCINYDLKNDDLKNGDLKNDLNINKISHKLQKEYLINITNFKTLINPANEMFYTQNTFYNAKLYGNAYEKSISRSRWNLINNFK